MSDASSGTRVELKDVSAGYGGGPVVRDIAFTVEPGRLLALLGPSGCGKTTILKVIAGLLTPSAGEVIFDREPVTRVPAEQRSAPMVFQKPLLFPHLSVFGNAAFGLKMKHAASIEIRDRVARALEMVQVSDLASRRPQELSGGQEQRVALARALVLRPRVLLLDEPFSALDERLRAEMRTLVRSLQRELGITTIFVTHDQQEASQMADEIAVVLSGIVEQVGTTRSFFESPRTAAVARFFGWQCLQSSNGEQIFFRPEQAVIEAAAGHQITGIVREIVDAGTHLVVRLQTGSGSLVEIHQSPHALPDCTAGATVGVRLPSRGIVHVTG